jgi:intracellular septation protein
MSEGEIAKAASPEAPTARLPVKLAIDFGPLLVFFLANALGGIYWATGLFMLAFFVALAVGYGIERRLEPVTLFTGLVVLVFGGLTLWLHNDTFVKMKPTILYGAMSLVLFGGLRAGRPLTRVMFERAFQLTDEGWRKLTIRWAFFFAGLAILNEIVRHVASTDQWVTFKVFGIIPLVMVFTFAQAGLIARYSPPAKTD